MPSVVPKKAMEEPELFDFEDEVRGKSAEEVQALVIYKVFDFITNKKYKPVNGSISHADFEELYRLGLIGIAVPCDIIIDAYRHKMELMQSIQDRKPGGMVQTLLTLVKLMKSQREPDTMQSRMKATLSRLWG